MKLIWAVNSFLSFLLTMLTSTVAFLLASYVLFDGKEQSGKVVTVSVAIISLLILAISIYAGRQSYKFVRRKTFAMNAAFLLALVLLLIGCFSSVRLIRFLVE